MAVLDDIVKEIQVRLQHKYPLLTEQQIKKSLNIMFKDLRFYFINKVPIIFRGRIKIILKSKDKYLRQKLKNHV